MIVGVVVTTAACHDGKACHSSQIIVRAGTDDSGEGCARTVYVSFNTYLLPGDYSRSSYSILLFKQVVIVGAQTNVLNRLRSYCKPRLHYPRCLVDKALKLYVSRQPQTKAGVLLCCSNHRVRIKGASFWAADAVNGMSVSSTYSGDGNIFVPY